MKVNKNESAGSRLWMSLCLAALSCALLQANGNAQTNTPPAKAANRYLLIVETSRAMQERLDPTFHLIGELFTSGMAGQLERGDTIGLWTFNNELHAGKYPLRAWSPGARTNMAMNMINFLRSQKFEKKPGFEKVMPPLQQIVRGSDYITVIVISSGEAPLKGTPFDSQINKYYSDLRYHQKATRMPFIAILRGQKGQFADSAIHAAPWRVELPALPPELVAARAVKPVAARTISRASLPPLTFSGPKPASTGSSAPSERSLPTTSGSPPASMPQMPAPSFVSQPVKETPSSDLKSEGPVVRPESFAAPTPSAKAVGEHPQVSSTSTSTNSLVSAPALSAPVVEAVRPASPPTPSVEKPVPSQAVASSPVVALPSGSLVNGKLLWLVAGLCLLLVGLIFWRLREHPRPPLHVSLITRSFEREQE